MNILYSLLAAQGRNGDTELAHVTPEEQALLKSRGGAGTINPKTGLKEFNPDKSYFWSELFEMTEVCASCGEEIINE